MRVLIALALFCGVCAGAAHADSHANPHHEASPRASLMGMAIVALVRERSMICPTSPDPVACNADYEAVLAEIRALQARVRALEHPSHRMTLEEFLRMREDLEAAGGRADALRKRHGSPDWQCVPDEDFSI